MAKQSEFYHTFKRLRPSDGTAWDTEKERVLEQAWWEAMVRADEMLEAAEFESLVAARLADIYSEVESEICHVTDIIQGSEYPIAVLFHGRYKDQYTEHGHSHKDAPCRALYHAEGFVYPRDKEPERKPKCQFKPFDKILVRE